MSPAIPLSKSSLTNLGLLLHLFLLIIISLLLLTSSACGDSNTSGPPAGAGAGAGDDDDDNNNDNNDSAPSGEVIISFIVDTPPDTPFDASVFIAGGFQGWNPGDPAFELTRFDSSLFSIDLTFSAGDSLQFKFTRGDWARVEKGPSGEEIANRTLRADSSGTHHFTVASWADHTQAEPTITGDVREIEVPRFLAGRPVWIYLPPGYDDSESDYSVLYMLDGQNIFDETTSFAGEWMVDEMCEELIGRGEIEPIIVVAIENGGENRAFEYTPWRDDDFRGGMGGGGMEHLAAINSTLIPYVEEHYRARPGAEERAFAGSSLGGLMALYAAYAESDMFGAVAGLSPSLWWDSEHLTAFADSSTFPMVLVYADMGTEEDSGPNDDDGNGIDDNIDQLRRFRDVLLEDGFIAGEDLFIVEDEGGRHNESSWAARFPEVLRILFPPTDQ